jgi:hypothetical protein
MKHIHSPQSKTLTLVIGTFALLLVTSFLLSNIRDAYNIDDADWLAGKKQPENGKQLAVMKKGSDGLVIGDSHRSLDGKRMNLDIAISGLPKPKSGNYGVYFARKSNIDDRLYVARFGAPQVEGGKSTYRLTGWGPEDWLSYDMLIVVDETSSLASPVASGVFVNEL